MQVLKKDNELARKGAHSFLAILLAFAPYYIPISVTVFFLITLFIVFALLRFLKVSTHFHNVFRVTYGELFFPVGILSSLFILQESPNLFTLSILILAFSDPLAALVGKRFGTHVYHFLGEKRSLEGSFACFLSVLVLCTLFLIPLREALLLAFILTVIEIVSLKGADNFSLPLTTAIFFMFV